MDMRIYFAGNQKVNVEYKGMTIATDQPKKAGGDGSAPGPFDLFVSSIGACAGFYVLAFCESRGIPTEGIELHQNMEHDPAKRMISKISIEILVPPSFPEKYYDALVSAANQCAVKKHIHEAPRFEVVTKLRG